MNALMFMFIDIATANHLLTVLALDLHFLIDVCGDTFHRGLSLVWLCRTEKTECQFIEHGRDAVAYGSILSFVPGRIRIF